MEENRNKATGEIEDLSLYDAEINDALFIYGYESSMSKNSFLVKYFDACDLFMELKRATKGYFTKEKFKSLKKESSPFAEIFKDFRFTDFTIDERFDTIPGYYEYIYGLANTLLEKSQMDDKEAILSRRKFEQDWPGYKERS